MVVSLACVPGTRLDCRPVNVPLWSQTATALKALLDRGEVSSEEVTRAHLARIDDVNGRVNAFTEVLRQEALEAAKVADSERAKGVVRGPLHGLPVTVKECLSMKGRASTVGVRSRRHHSAERDAALVTLLREGGAVITGRTNLSQCMIYAESSNPVFGTTHNPFAKDRTPGGSSGGEGAAIASGMSCLGVGTDIGGSIRIPAAYTGIYGLMPTLDRWPLWGSVPGIPGQESIRGAAGPMARSAKDLSLLLHAFDPKRMSALDPRTPPLPWEAPESVRGKTFGVLRFDGVFEPSTAVKRALDIAEKALVRAGAKTVPYNTKVLEEAAFLYLGIMSSDGGKTMRNVCEGSPIDKPLQGLFRIAKMPATLRAVIAAGLQRSGQKRAARSLSALGEKSVADVWNMHVRLRALRQNVLDEWAALGIDALLCPATSTPALQLGASRDFILGMTYTYVWNTMHFPAGVAPITSVDQGEERGRTIVDGFDKKAAKVDEGSVGLPIGVQIVAPPYREACVLGALEALEREVSSAEDYPRTPTMFA